MVSPRRQRIHYVLAWLAIALVLFVFRDRIFPHPHRYPDSGLDKGFSAPAPASLQLADDDVELVVASMKRENITWLDDYLLDWKKNIYVVDDATADLTVPLNKGREAMVFLTYDSTLPSPIPRQR